MGTPLLEEVERFLRRAPLLHLYELGDLDVSQTPYTTWFAGRDGAGVDAVGLLYRGLAVPTLVALAHGPLEPYRKLLVSIRGQLPERLYMHLSVGLSEVLSGAYRLTPLGLHLKMGLRAAPSFEGTERVSRFGPADAAELQRFYKEAYPGSYFEPAALRTGPYVGVRDERGIACAAGCHVFSRQTRVAALGNIATRPDVRGGGLARVVTSALCAWLAPDVDHIGLNVRADNEAAIACYRRVGFEALAEYEEFRADA